MTAALSIKKLNHHLKGRNPFVDLSQDRTFLGEEMVETWGQLVPALMPMATQPEPALSPGNSGNTACRLSPRSIGRCGKRACPQKAEDPRALNEVHW